MKIIATVLIILVFSGCFLGGPSLNNWPEPPYPNPDDIDKYESGSYKSITYTYYCLNGRYVSITYSQTSPNTSWKKSEYSSSGICD